MMEICQGKTPTKCAIAASATVGYRIRLELTGFVELLRPFHLASLVTRCGWVMRSQVKRINDFVNHRAATCSIPAQIS